MDVEYAWTQGRPDPASWASRIALVGGLFPRRVRSRYGPIGLLERILKLWRARCAVLHRLEWPRLEDRLDLQYARNCPPFPGPVTGKAGMRRCRIRHMCPWCFSMDVAAPAYRAASDAVRLGASRVAVACYPLRVGVEKMGAAEFTRLVREKSDFLSRFWRRSGALGGMVLWTVAPAPPEGEEWVGRIRVLLLLPEEPIPGEGQAGIWGVWPARRKRSAFRATARFAAYPGGMLTAPAERVEALLSARPRCRAVSCFGVLYGRSKSLDQNHNPEEEP